MLTALACTKNTPRLTNLDDIMHLPSSSCSRLISHNLSTTDIAFVGSLLHTEKLTILMI